MGTNTEEEARSALFLAGEAAFDRLPEIGEGTAVCIAENQMVAAVCRAEGGKWQGKTLENWPEDIYRFAEDGSMVFGKYYLEWLTFRSGIIREFALYLRKIIQEYREKEHREIALAAYVGSWYDLYYQNGVNWASKEFCCHDMLKFPLRELYTQEYGKTSYLEAIDFLMIGCYYDTRELVEKYATLGNLVTNNEIPIIASLSLPDLRGEESLCAAVGACLDYSDGLMVFDLCYTNWEELSNAIGAAEGTGRHQD